MTNVPAPLLADSACELITSRGLPFPREQVFRAWTAPALLCRWWGPNGFTCTFRQFEPRAGGEWRHVMHGPDGANYDNYSVFRLVAPERIELTHVSQPHFDLVVTLERQGGGTWLTFLQRFPSPTVRNALAAICIPANEQNLDRLTQVLRLAPPADR